MVAQAEDRGTADPCEDANFTISAMVAHPNVADVIFYGSLVGADHPDLFGCFGGPCDTPGVGILQRRWQPQGGQWKWSRRMLEEDSLASPRIVALDWTVDYGTSSPNVEWLWVATAGSGVLDGMVGW